jgi:hypothetical protein
MNGLSGPRRFNAGVRLHMALVRPFRLWFRGSFLRTQFCCYFPPLRYVRNMHTHKAVESRHCMACGKKDWEENPHLRCRCGAQFCDHCIQAHCCSGVMPLPRTPRV